MSVASVRVFNLFDEQASGHVDHVDDLYAVLTIMTILQDLNTGTAGLTNHLEAQDAIHEVSHWDHLALSC